MSAKKTERNERIVEMHEQQGMTYAEIAKEMGISAARVFAIYQRERERREKEEQAE